MHNPLSTNLMGKLSPAAKDAVAEVLDAAELSSYGPKALVDRLIKLSLERVEQLPAAEAQIAKRIIGMEMTAIKAKEAEVDYGDLHIDVDDVLGLRVSTEVAAGIQGATIYVDAFSHPEEGESPLAAKIRACVEALDDGLLPLLADYGYRGRVIVGQGFTDSVDPALVDALHERYKDVVVDADYARRASQQLDEAAEQVQGGFQALMNLIKENMEEGEEGLTLGEAMKRAKAKQEEGEEE